MLIYLLIRRLYTYDCIVQKTTKLIDSILYAKKELTSVISAELVFLQILCSSKTHLAKSCGLFGGPLDVPELAECPPRLSRAYEAFDTVERQESLRSSLELIQ